MNERESAFESAWVEHVRLYGSHGSADRKIGFDDGFAAGYAAARAEDAPHDGWILVKSWRRDS